MKHLLTTSVKLALSVAILLSACSKYNSDSNPPPPAPTGNNSALTSGTWVISSFSQRSEDKTADFAGKVFTFAQGGTASVTTNGTAANGTWSYTAGQPAYYGNPATDPTLTLDFGTEAPMNELKGTWIVETLSATLVQLKSQQANDDEHVKFAKQ
jgi:hypothetical protein